MRETTAGNATRPALETVAKNVPINARLSRYQLIRGPRDTSTFDKRLTSNVRAPADAPKEKPVPPAAWPVLAAPNENPLCACSVLLEENSEDKSLFLACSTPSPSDARS
jgi:hypothetical protein